MLKPFFIIILLFTLSACGGGGESSQPNNPTPISDSNNDSWSPKEPPYSGIRGDFDITPSNASETMVNIIESLDFLHMFAFGKDYSQYYFLSENSIALLDDEATCIRGTISTKEVEENKRIEVTYDKCLIDTLEVNGTIKAKSDGTVIPNLTMLDTVTNKNSFINGYFNLLGTTTATYNLIMETEGEQLWFNNFKLIWSDYSLEKGIKYQGDIYISDGGKLKISTTSLGSRDFDDPKTVELLVSSNIDILLLVVLQNDLTFAVSGDYLPITIPLSDSYSNFDSSQPNLPPHAKISPVTLEANRNTPLLISAAQSTDPNFDPLSVKWEFVSGSDDEEWKENSDHSITFSANNPGEYTIKLIVTDLQGEESFVEKTIKVLKSSPKPTISYAQTTNYIGQSFVGSIDLDNDELDGPFSYKLKYGPANMTIDSNGEIQWDAAIPNFGYDTNINFAIYIENSDAFTVFKDSISLKSETKPVIETVSPPWVYFTPSSSLGISSFINQSENIETLYQGGKILSKLLLNNEKLEIKHLAFYNKYENAEYRAVYDANNDGVDDYWFSSRDNNTLLNHIYWRDGKTSEEHKFMVTDGALSFLRILDYDNDNQKDLLLSTGQPEYKTQVIDIKTKEVKLTLGRFFTDYKKSCDFNGDGYMDFMSDKYVRDYQTNERIYERGDYGVMVAVDSNNDGICEVLHYKEQSLTWIDLTGKTESVVLLENYFIHDMVSGNFDTDNSEEILIEFSEVGKYFNQVLKVNTDVQNKVTLHELTKEIRVDKHGSLNHIAVLDIDGDGIDEILKNGSLPSDSYYDKRIIAAKLIQGEFKEVYSSDALADEEYSLINWNSDDELLYLSPGQSQLVKINKNADSEVLIDENNIRNATIENNIVYAYLQNDSQNLSKVDIAFTEFWNKKVTDDNGFDLKNFGDFLLIKGASSNDNLVNLYTGEVIYEIPKVDANKYSFYDVSPSGLPKYIASRRSQSLIKVNADLTVDVIFDSANGDLMSNASDYSFIQYDNDEQLELIIYENIHLGRKYKLLDIQTLELEPFTNLHSGEINNTIITDEEILPCFEWDKKCQNLIYLKPTSDRNALTKSYKRLKVVDKLTGVIIWQTPELIIDDIIIKKEDHKIKAAISLEGGHIYTVN